MKKEWQPPVLEILDFSMTMGGPGNSINDSYCTNNQDFETHEDQSNHSNNCS